MGINVNHRTRNTSKTRVGMSMVNLPLGFTLPVISRIR